MSGQLLDWEKKVDRTLHKVPTYVDADGHQYYVHLMEDEITGVQKYKLPEPPEEWLEFWVSADCVGPISEHNTQQITLNSVDISDIKNQLDIQGYTLQKKEMV